MNTLCGIVVTSQVSRPLWVSSILTECPILQLMCQTKFRNWLLSYYDYGASSAINMVSELALQAFDSVFNSHWALYSYGRVPN